MNRTLEGAIDALLADAQAQDTLLLKPAPAAEELAQEFGGDPHEIAERIIERAIKRGMNIELKRPDTTEQEQAYK